jgi:hypothetical protein
MSEIERNRGASNQQVARAGEHFVVAELNKRGAFAMTFAGNMLKIDLIACNQDQSRTIRIQVKTKRGGKTWHASTNDGRPMEPPVAKDETTFWIFVNLGDVSASPEYWIVPEWWIQNDIYSAHKSYLQKHGGIRAINPGSRHHAITEDRLKNWFEKWDDLGIFS